MDKLSTNETEQLRLAAIFPWFCIPTSISQKEKIIRTISYDNLKHTEKSCDWNAKLKAIFLTETQNLVLKINNYYNKPGKYSKQMHVTLCNSYTPILDFYSNTTTVKDLSGTVQGKIYELYEGHSNICQLYDIFPGNVPNIWNRRGVGGLYLNMV